MFLIDIKVNKCFKTEEMWDELLVFVILYLVLILINIKQACDACFEEFFGHFFVVLIGRKLNEYVIKLFKVFCQH